MTSDNEAVKPTSNLQRSETATTTAAFDIEKGSIGGGSIGAPYLVTAGPQPAAPNNSFITAPQTVLEAYRASLSLRCAGIIDCVLCVVSALTWWNLWGFLMILLCPFGLMARYAAVNYGDGIILQTYIVYTFFVIVLHCFLAFILFANFFPFDGAFELLKASIYIWFSYVAYKFRTSIRGLTREDKDRLRSGRFTIARTEQLIYV